MTKLTLLATVFFLSTALTAQGQMSVKNNGGPGGSALLLQSAIHCIDEPDLDFLFKLLAENFREGEDAVEFFSTYAEVGRDFATMANEEKSVFCEFFTKAMTFEE